MNREEQVEAYEEAQEYLQTHDVYGLLGQLLQQVVQEKPANVLDFLISKLEAPESKPPVTQGSRCSWWARPDSPLTPPSARR